MAATTADRAFRSKLVPTEFELDAYDVAATATLYAGTMAIIDSNGDLDAPAGSDGATTVVVWIDENVDNSAGAAGDETYAPKVGCVREVIASGLTDADNGKVAYVADNQTITLTAGTNAIAGKIFKVLSATRAFVYFPGVI